MVPLTPQSKRSGQANDKPQDRRASKGGRDTISTTTIKADSIMSLGNTESSMNEMEGEDELSMDLQRLKTTYYSTDEEDNDRPGTPVQDSKSLLACFYNSSGKAIVPNSKHSQSQAGNTEKYSSLQKLPSTRSLQSANGHDHIIIISDSSHGNIEKGTAPGIDLEEKIASTVDKKQNPSKSNNQVSDKPTEKPSSAEIQEDEQYEEEYEEEEYEEEYDQPMSLRLSNGGRIGTLDIRLVGKELHILVEDAFLTLEAVPIVKTEKGDEDELDDDSHDGSTGGHSTNSGADVASSAAKSSKKADSKTEPSPKGAAKATKPEPPRATVGERVVAENFLARAIAAIPHLFLRDIRVRLIVRHDTPPQTHETEASTNGSTKEQGDMKGEQATAVPGTKDTFVEFAVNFLSVTSGEDVLSHFQPAAEEESDDSATGGASPSHAASRSTSRSYSRVNSSKPPMSSIPSFSSVDSTMEQNEFLVRHIRTGRGPEGGIWMKILTPSERPMPRPGGDDSPTWARHSWLMAAEYHFFRCSGVDIQARILLGTKKEVARSAWFYDDFDDDEEDEDFVGYDENTLDSMLWSVDYVAPGPQLPFPPASPYMSRGDTPVRERHSSFDNTESHGTGDNLSQSAALFAHHDGADVFFKDRNGIQSCKIPSNFHRVGRGMTPGSCKTCEHLPCDTSCWDQPSDGSSATDNNPLDASLPMPGLILQITMREPLEINADRDSLQSIGLLQSLFVKKKIAKASDGESSVVEEANENTSSTVATKVISTDEAAQKPASSRGMFSGFLSRPGSQDVVKDEPSDAFPSYMQPEHIQIIGLHLAKFVFRVHMMQAGSTTDRSLSFCYWDTVARCVNLDYQALMSPLSPNPVPEMKIFQDVRFDVGHLDLTEFKGLSRNKLMVLGLRHKDQSQPGFDLSASRISIRRDDEPKAPWPSMACVLLDLPPPLETLIYKSRQSHGMQLRFLAVVTTRATHLQKMDQTRRSQLNLRLGATSICMPWQMKKEVSIVCSEAMACVFGTPIARDERSPTPGHAQHDQTPKKPDSLMRYKVHIDGGIINAPPLMNVRMPLTKFSGEQSPESGMFMETVLDHFHFSYGDQHPSSTSSGRKRLSLLQLATLPENVRLRLLLFLEDLGPLEQALQVKKETNPFMRYRAINKGIVNMAKTFVKSHASIESKSKVSGESSTCRRQGLMTELLKLDDDELDDLLSAYRKRAKKNVTRQSQVISKT
jgi:hypothetical protein